MTILSGPFFSPSTNAPLAGTLQLTSDVPSRVSIQVSYGTNNWERDFYDFATAHSEMLLGFRPAETNSIRVIIYDKYRNAYTNSQALSFVTSPLPGDFPTLVLLTNKPALMEPGYTLFSAYNISTSRYYITILDNTAEVVWYCLAPGVHVMDVKQLNNGDLFFPQTSPSNSFVEMNLLGQNVNVWPVPAQYPINNHDGILTSHGTILYLTDIRRMVTNFPINGISNAPTVTTNIDDNPVVEFSTNSGALLNVWSPLTNNLMDSTRITYLTFAAPDANGVDNEHANAVIEDTNDNCILLSLRNQNAVLKFSRAGRLQWILGPPANWGTNFQKYLLTPQGTPFAWNYAEHSLMLTPQGTLLIYDNGNYRASPWDAQVMDQSNYSRGVEFYINPTNMTVTQMWDSSASGGDRLFTPIFGKTQWLPQRTNLLVTYGDITYINGVHPSAFSPMATMARIIEYTHDAVPQEVFDLSLFDYTNTGGGYLGYAVYRALRISDLYAHSANAVANLVVTEENNIPHLEFSTDPTHTYEIQCSSDLQNWTTIGTAAQEDGAGDFDFDDTNAYQYQDRFYRVVTD